jgi:riboflavin kinase/FMN adenylyltransferase
MHIYEGYDHVPQQLRGAAVAIGNFDGVHRGHQALLERVRERAAASTRHGASHLAGVMVFEPHPREFFQPDRPHFRLTTLKQKLRHFERLGMDMAIVIPFDRRLAQFSSDEFIEQVLVAGLGVRHVVIGYDFFFGKGRGGNAEDMQRAGAEMGFGVSVIAPQAEGGEVFSSSAIRAEIAQGDVRDAARMLGHWWAVAGTVVGGAKRGTGMGFPTANIQLPRGTTLAFGIYAVFVEVGGQRHRGAAYLGTRPTFDNGVPVLEVFLFDFDGDLYGREIEVAFVDFIRGDKRFDSMETLMEQMDKDCAAARLILDADASAKP